MCHSAKVDLQVVIVYLRLVFVAGLSDLLALAQGRMRQLPLPENIQKDKVRAHYENGILRIRVAKGKPLVRSKPKKIAVK